jgi:hypothetical protein
MTLQGFSYVFLSIKVRRNDAALDALEEPRLFTPTLDLP